MKYIKTECSVIDAPLNSGYESVSSFRDVFPQIIGDAPNWGGERVLNASWLDTPLGAMLCIVDDDGVYLLGFVERRGLAREVERLRKRLKVAVIPGKTHITQNITMELGAYFSGKCFSFKTPIHIIGTDFQKKVWQTLMNIPAGETRAYVDVARAIHHPKAFRAVALANGANQLALVIPCHRVINSNGDLGGYAAGISRKKWLIQHEKGSAN